MKWITRCGALAAKRFVIEQQKLTSLTPGVPDQDGYPKSNPFFVSLQKTGFQIAVQARRLE
jgi:hypothetical protein